MSPSRPSASVLISSVSRSLRSNVTAWATTRSWSKFPGVTDLDRIKRDHPVDGQAGNPRSGRQRVPDRSRRDGGAAARFLRTKILVHGAATGSGADEVWVLKRAAIVEGADFRDAQPSRDENGRPGHELYPHHRGRTALLQVHRCGQRHPHPDGHRAGEPDP